MVTSVTLLTPPVTCRAACEWLRPAPVGRGKAVRLRRSRPGDTLLRLPAWLRRIVSWWGRRGKTVCPGPRRSDGVIHSHQSTVVRQWPAVSRSAVTRHRPLCQSFACHLSAAIQSSASHRRTPVIPHPSSVTRRPSSSHRRTPVIPHPSSVIRRPSSSPLPVTAGHPSSPTHRPSSADCGIASHPVIVHPLTQRPTDGQGVIGCHPSPCRLSNGLRFTARLSGDSLPFDRRTDSVSSADKR